MYLLQHNMQHYIWPLIKVLVSFQTWVCTYYNTTYHIWPLIKVLVSFQTWVYVPTTREHAASYMASDQSISIFSVSVYIYKIAIIVNLYFFACHMMTSNCMKINTEIITANICPILLLYVYIPSQQSLI